MTTIDTRNSDQSSTMFVELESDMPVPKSVARGQNSLICPTRRSPSRGCDTKATKYGMACLPQIAKIGKKTIDKTRIEWVGPMDKARSSGTSTFCAESFADARPER